MHLLITGATGFLGFRTVEYFSDLSSVQTIVATGRSLKPYHTVNHPKVNYVLGNLEDETFVKKLFSYPITHVINCASLSSPWGNYKDFYAANCITQQLLIEQAIEKKIQMMVYISTGMVYFNGENRLGIKESDPLPSEFANVYATTKFKAEEMIRQSGLTHIIIRPKGIIGRGDTVIIPRLLRANKEGKLKIIGKGNSRIDFTHVGNLVEAIHLSLQAKPNALNKTYNISNGQEVELWHYIGLILTRMGMEKPTSSIPEWLAYSAAQLMEWNATYLNKNKEPAITKSSIGTLTRSMTLDISLAKENLGYNPKFSYEHALEEFIEWRNQLKE